MNREDRIHNEISELASTVAFMLVECEHGQDYVYQDGDVQKLRPEANVSFHKHYRTIHRQLQNLRKTIQYTHDD